MVNKKSGAVCLSRLSVIVLVALIVMAGSWSAVGAETGGAPPDIGWDDVVPAARFRGFGDWLADTGKAKLQDVYGPFPTRAYRQGDTERFYALDFGRKGTPRILTAQLRLVTKHAYWWFEDGTDADQDDIAKAGERFESEIYALNHALFGEEWMPGIDGDPRMFILHQKKIGGYAVGVFSTRDECPRKLCAGSNQHEMIYIGLDYGPPNSVEQLTVISHELVHLIQYNNGDEQRWLEEGLAQLAEHLNGFNPRTIAGSNLRDFLHHPNFQLDSWPVQANADPGVNYAVSYIFCVYLYQRFGTPFIQHLARSPYKGLAAIEEALRAMDTGKKLDEVFADWTVTNYVNSPYVDDGRYYYQSLTLPQRAGVQELTLNRARKGEVHQYGSDYLQLSGSGTYTLTFQGDTTLRLADTRPKSGQWMWWSYNEEQGAARLERDFDLTSAKNPKLTYNAWWDFPSDYSWADVQVSSDGGQHWNVVKATSTQTCRFMGGFPCYTDRSRNWKPESVDLSSYAGKKIRLRFEYVTDGGPPGEGLYLDDITLAAVGYKDNVEAVDSTWTRQGFMRVTGDLPQHWAVNVITRDTPPKVLPVKLDAKNTGTLKFAAPKNGAVIVIAAMAPFVSTTTHYTIQARRN